MHAPSPQPIRVAVSHPLPLIAAGVVHALSRAPGIEARAIDAAAAPQVLAHDIVITDPVTALGLAGAATDTGLPRGRLAVIADEGRAPEVNQALAAGVQGYLLIRSSTAEVLRCVQALSTGTPYLTEAAVRCVADSIGQVRLTTQEARVLGLLAEGLCNKAIARQLQVGPSTVKTHVRAVLGKLGVSNRTQAALVARQRGLTPASAQGRVDPGPELG